MKMNPAMRPTTSIRPFNVPPCFNYFYFIAKTDESEDNTTDEEIGVGVVTLNDPMANLLADILNRSGVRHPVLNAIAKELVGESVEEEFDDSNDDIPSYAYQYFENVYKSKNCGTLFLNNAAITLLTAAMAQKEDEMHRAVQSLYYKFRNEENKVVANFTYVYFYGTVIVTLNDVTADFLASALNRSELQHPLLETIAKELVGKSEEEEEFDDDVVNTPDTSCSYQYFKNCGTLFLNKNISSLLEMAIIQSGGGRNIYSTLSELHQQLKEGYKAVSEKDDFQSKAI